MAFRKRNVPVNNTAMTPGASPGSIARPPALPGTKPSLLTPHCVTSTGTAELDGLLGGHGGLTLGSSLLVGEHGATDYSGALLRAFAAEGLLQGHDVHLVGVDKSWTNNLPGVATDAQKHKHGSAAKAEERMKIAWRYENLERPATRGLPMRTSPQSNLAAAQQSETPFCHTFDLTKRLGSAAEHKLEYIAVNTPHDPFGSVLQRLSRSLDASPASTIHRIVIPQILSPPFYPASGADPAHALHFMHGLKALLSRHANAVAMISIPLTLYPRNSGVLRWLEHLSDGVMELQPFPYIAGATLTSEGKAETAQGMLKISKLPLATDRGEGGAGAGNTIGDDLAFTLGRRKFLIEPYSLPPVEGDQEAQQEAGKITAKNVEF